MIRTVIATSIFALGAAACATTYQPARTAVAPVQAQDSYHVKGHDAVARRAAERNPSKA